MNVSLHLGECYVLSKCFNLLNLLNRYLAWDSFFKKIVKSSDLVILFCYLLY